MNKYNHHENSSMLRLNWVPVHLGYRFEKAGVVLSPDLRKATAYRKLAISALSRLLKDRNAEHGVKVAASSWRLRQPSSRRNQCNRQGKQPKARSPRPARAKDYLDRFFTRGRPISGCRLPSASSRRRHRNQPRTTLLRLW